MKLTIMVCANFQSLVPSHHQPNLSVDLVFEELDITGSTLFPFGRGLLEPASGGWRVGDFEVVKPRGRGR